MREGTSERDRERGTDGESDRDREIDRDGQTVSLTFFLPFSPFLLVYSSHVMFSLSSLALVARVK